ncbi:MULTISPECIES: hypothetical protein [unclassified Bradyrhizobium]|uniref:hypothetical protein n=1 Tax=unclassified Bradyrhizobium TaxID=2631580 RepID=UPI00247977B2|nr:MULTISPECIES: hypothetical protein [unclassified Bradyrhizobium]WGR68323.1 hypothetical protein MTX24_23085 [Bradyrhizobium sp. ISRA426]WGR80378.1 hypothetical protein MTX21_08200 [Bradyrhizobium sp. ISRA430]WGR83563.1 hypothetical protein MTX25_22765 [Bradyrhizobium sp. ISRA432]
MAAISADSQRRLPASLRQIWGRRSGRIDCLVFLTTGFSGQTSCPLSRSATPKESGKM